jgi:hypothetical protein
VALVEREETEEMEGMGEMVQVGLLKLYTRILQVFL